MWPYPKVLKYGTPNTTTFPFVPNVEWWLLGVPIFIAHYNVAVMCPNFGTPKIINFPFGTNGKFIIFRCPNT